MSDTKENPPHSTPSFLAILDEIREMYLRKSHDYGSKKDTFTNVRASIEFGIAPWIGALVRLNDKIVRIKSFIEKGVLKNESVEDSLLDIAVYAIISLCLRREELSNLPAPINMPTYTYTGPYGVMKLDTQIIKKATERIKRQEDCRLIESNAEALKTKIEAQEAIDKVRCSDTVNIEEARKRALPSDEWQPQFKVGQVVEHNSKNKPRLKITKIQEGSQTYKAHFVNDTDEIPFEYTWMESELLEAPSPTCFWEFKETLMQDQWKGTKIFKCRFCKASEHVKQESDLPKRICPAQQ